MYSQRKKGVGLIEALFVLGIMMTLLGAVMVFLSYANNRTKVNQTQIELMNIVSILHQYANSNETIDDAFLVKSNNISQKYIKNNSLVSAFGTPVIVNASGKNFNVEIDGLTKANCILFSTQDYGNSIASIRINDSLHIQMDGILNPEQAEKLCSSSSNSFSVTSDKE